MPAVFGETTVSERLAPDSAQESGARRWSVLYSGALGPVAAVPRRTRHGSGRNVDRIAERAEVRE